MMSCIRGFDKTIVCLKKKDLTFVFLTVLSFTIMGHAFEKVLRVLIIKAKKSFIIFNT